MPTYLITGATSGLGLQAAQCLAHAGNRLILPVRDPARGEALRRQLQAAGKVEVTTPLLDLASLRNVADFAKTAGAVPALDGVLLNAGVQSAQRLEFTADGYETTFAVNHLAHYRLLQGLLQSLSAGAVVVWTASGTHDPRKTAGRLFGFRGGQYSSAARLAKGDFGDGVAAAQTCRDAYASSKLCNIVAARIFAQRHPRAASFYAFDPGLMPGTGLARQHPPAMQWLWRNVLPRLAAVLPETSTVPRSAGLLADLLTGRLRGSHNGAYFDYTGREIEPAPLATERWVAEDLASASDQLLQAFA